LVIVASGESDLCCGRVEEAVVAPNTQDLRLGDDHERFAITMVDRREPRDLVHAEVGVDPEEAQSLAFRGERPVKLDERVSVGRTDWANGCLRAVE
jgi:hypothetical protein